MALGLAYGEFALRKDQLDRLLFGFTDLGDIQKRSAEPGSTWDLVEAVGALSLPASAVERAIDARRVRPQNSARVATQVLSANHGFMLLASGLVDPEKAQDVMASLAVN